MYVYVNHTGKGRGQVMWTI